MYTFKIDIGSFSNPVIGTGYIDCNPLKNGAKYKKYRHEKYKRIIRESIEGKLTFRNIPNGNQEYTALKTLENSNELYVPIKCYFNGELKLTGRLDLYGYYDVNKNICNLSIQTEDTYTILLNNLDKEIDIKGASATTAKTNIYSTIITQESPSCTTRSANEEKVFLFGDDADLWVFSSSDSTGCDPGETRYTFKSSALRWAATGYTYSSLTSLYQKATTTSELVQVSLIRYRKMVDVLNYIFDLIDNSISADEDTISDYFNDEDTEMKYLMIADKSDIKRYSSDTEAGFEYIKVSEFFDIYKNISNLDWAIDNNEFKLIYPDILQLPNLETYPYHDFTSDENFINLQRYEFDINSLINKETWNFEKTKNLDFNEQEITYDNLSENSKSYSSVLINTDLEFILTDSDEISDNGFSVIATNKSGSDYLIINKTGQIAPITFLNGKLAISNIIIDHMINGDRPFPKGTFNDEEKLLTTRGIKKLTYNNVPIFDPEFINFKYAIKTELGNVEPILLEIDLELRNFSKFEGFLLPLGLPIVETLSSENITSSTAKINCEVINDNGYEVTERGIVYSENENPTTSDNKESSGSGIGTYYVNLSGLDQSTVYYIRAYAINENGTSYGNQIEVTTLGTLAAVTTDSYENVTALTADVNGTVVSDGGSTVTQRGVCYSKTPLPTTSGDKKTSGSGIGSFIANLTNLDYSSTYYIRAYAINAVGTKYGNQLSFTTLDADTLWNVLGTNPTINDDQVDATITCINDVTILVRFSIYINDSWKYDEQIFYTGFNKLIPFTVSNPLGNPIPSGTQWKTEVTYDSITYLEDSGTL